MANITRARRRAIARRAQHLAERSKRRRRWIGTAAGVFAAGIVLGTAGGLLLTGEANQTPRQVASTPTAVPSPPATAGARERPAETTKVPDGTSPDSRAPTASPEAPGAADDTRSAPAAAPARARVTEPRRQSPPPWRRYAAASAAVPEGTPRIAIVIDDLGLNRANAWETVRLPGPLTLAFMTYAPGLAEITGAAREAGHELLVHVPMQPTDAETEAGPKVLQIGLGPAELRRRLDWALSRFDGFVGVNNHMGSAFTADREGMRVVLAELERRGLLFLDSRTIAASVGDSIAAELGVPHAGRDVFLDNERDPEAIRARLAEVARIARAQGSAIAIGHPYEETIRVLADWLPSLERRDLALVPVSALAKTGPRRPDLAELSE